MTRHVYIVHRGERQEGSWIVGVFARKPKDAVVLALSPEDTWTQTENGVQFWRSGCLELFVTRHKVQP